MTLKNYEERQALARKRLKALSEEELKAKIIIPFFTQTGWIAEDVDRRHEEEHKCDVLLTLRGHEDDLLRGVQLKANKNVGKKRDAENLRALASAAFRYGHRRTRGEIRLDRYYWITTGDVRTGGWRAIKEYFDEDATVGGRVEIWDVSALVREIERKGCAALLEELALNPLEKQARFHEGKGEGIFAAKSWLEVFRWHLTHAGGDRGAAIAALECAGEAISGEARKGAYYYRTLRQYCKMWLTLLRSGVAIGRAPRLIELLERRGSDELLKGEYGDEQSGLVRDVEFVFQQLQLLQELQGVKYSSLGVLQTTRLLLRTGFSPGDPEIERRLQCIQDELLENQGRCIDLACSLCTGCAISCFSLANRRQEVEIAVDWLAGLNGERYAYGEGSYTDAAADEHALHYAAEALVGALDYDVDGGVLVEAMEQVFFAREGKGDNGFYQEWVRFRNVDELEIYRYILGAFLRLHLAGRTLPEERREFLCGGITALLSRLEENADRQIFRPWRLYAARQNLSSICLGLLLGVANLNGVTSEILGLFRARARVCMKSAVKGPRILIDSSVDRSQIFIEGFLQYWETILYVRESGKGGSQLAVEPIGKRPG